MSGVLEWESLTPSEKQAVKLISESSLLGFQRCFFSLMQGDKWQVNWHHRYMSTPIEQIINGERGSTLFNVPPGSGKTETLSIHAPVYSILKCPRVRNLNISFSDTLSKRNSRRTREIIKSREFQELWPHELGVDQADEWQLIRGGKVSAEVVSRSMGGQITGGRGGYPGPGFTGWISLDDIDKPSDMFSSVKRERVHEILVNTLRSRRGNKSKENPTPFVGIQQRLHVYDSTWFMMSGNMGIKFDLIKIPALLDDEYIGSLPDWIKDECWNSVKGSEKVRGYYSYWPSNEYIGDLMDLWERDEYTFMSQYMQDPIALGGNIFSADGWAFYGDGYDLPTPPDFDYRFITADTASKTKTYNDYSVFCEWGVWDGRIYLLRRWRGKWEAPELRAMFINIISDAWARNSLGDKGNLRDILVEDKSSGTGLIQDVGRSSPLPITPVQRNTDKVTRAMDAAPHVNTGKVVLPGGAEWLPEFISEHSAFTADDSHRFDDQVDNTMDAVQHAIIDTGSSAADLSIAIAKRRR